MLLRVKDAALNQAIDVLQKAHANMRKHKGLTIALPAVVADLAIDAARHGRIDEAIDELRATFALHMAGGSRVFVGCAGEALVGLLIERGSADDLTEAHRIVDQWQDRRPGIPALDLWWLKSRALLAKVGRRLRTATRSWPRNTSRSARSSTPAGDSMRRAKWSTKSPERM